MTPRYGRDADIVEGDNSIIGVGPPLVVSQWLCLSPPERRRPQAGDESPTRSCGARSCVDPNSPVENLDGWATTSKQCSNTQIRCVCCDAQAQSPCACASVPLFQGTGRPSRLIGRFVIHVFVLYAHRLIKTRIICICTYICACVWELILPRRSMSCSETFRAA